MMERRYGVTQNAPVAPSHHSSNSHLVRATNSFIPTSAAHHGHGHHTIGHHGHPTKSSMHHQHPPQPPPLHHNSMSSNNSANHNATSSPSMQNHVAMSQVNGLGANYYQNMGQNHTGTLGSRLDHHQSSLHQRTLSKANTSHYGTTTNNSTGNHQNTYYGTANPNPNAVVINGGAPSGHHNTHFSMHLPYGQHQLPLPTQPQNHQLISSQSHSQSMLVHHNGGTLPINSGGNAISNHVQPETEGLPQSLVESMRTLFDILDDTKQGKIRLSDIESRWESDTNGSTGKTTGAEPLIKMGVMGYLRKVTPSDGMLTFDRFCAGLRLALLTNNNVPNAPNQNLLPNANIMPLGQGQSQSQYQPAKSGINSNSSNGHVTNNGLNQGSNNPLLSQFNNKQNSTANIANSTQGIGLSQTNTMNRSSKIPSFSTSRLPMPNGTSGIPVSPNSRITGNMTGSMSASALPQGNNNTITKRHLASVPIVSELGTTVAMVHHPPPPNQKPIYSGGTLRLQSKPTVTSSLQSRYTSKNGSLDNLKTPSDEKVSLSSKDRPPSAPILDLDTSPPPLDKSIYSNGPTKVMSNLSNQRKDRARSHEREINDNRVKSRIPDSLEDGKKINFVSPRQRTLSMPQLQMNKLKPKSIIMNVDDSPPEKGGIPPTLTLKNTNIVANRIIGGGVITSSIPMKQSKSSSNEGSANNTISHPSLMNGHHVQEREKELPPPPPKPPRNAMSPSATGPVTISTNANSNSSSNPLHDAPLSESSTGSGSPSKPEIRTVLQTWQRGMTEKKPIEPTLSAMSVTTTSSVNTTNTAPAAIAPVPVNIKPLSATAVANEVKMRQVNGSKTNLKRRETPRRHTVQSGIDFATLKRLKQLEQERDVLQQGISYLEKANQWYAMQLKTADDRIQILSKGGQPADYSTESHEERLNLLGCRVSEVNSLLAALMDGSSQLPHHMNLQIPSHLSLRTITRLKEQNRLLTQEVSDCSHRVTQLETEKAMLLRQLFHQKTSTHSDETVYM